VPVHKGGKKGTKKYGRNKVKCARYKERGTLRKRKVRHLRRFNGLTRITAERVWDEGLPTPKRQEAT
jgi:hypothetical protein